MASPFKDFDAIIAARREQKGEPPRFRLAGTEFTCVPELAAHAVVEVAESENGVIAMIEFMKKMIVPEQRQAFQDLIDSDDTVISMETLKDLSDWLGEYYTGAPKEAPES